MWVGRRLLGRLLTHVGPDTRAGTSGGIDDDIGVMEERAVAPVARRHRSAPTSGHDGHKDHPAGIERMPVVSYTAIQNLGIASVGLVYVFAIAVGTMLLGGVIVHAINPHKSFDIFYALHNELVAGILLGLAIFWLLPPYPWVGKQSAGPEAQDPAKSAGETEAPDVANVTVLAEYKGRDPSPRPPGRREVSG